MTEQEVVEAARGVLIRRLKVNASMISTETVIQDLGADSLDLLMMAGEFEDLFNVDIPTKDIREIRTFGDIVRHLNQKLGLAA
jgi:acyl carrier protein